MEQKKPEINYIEEVDKIESRPTTDKLKLDAGLYVIKILAEPEKTFYIDEENPEKATEQIMLRVRCDGKEYNWYIAKGLTQKSAYYKLVYIGKHFGRLEGLTLKVNVIMAKKENGRTIRNYEFLDYFDIKSKEIKLANMNIEDV